MTKWEGSNPAEDAADRLYMERKRMVKPTIWADANWVHDASRHGGPGMDDLPQCCVEERLEKQRTLRKGLWKEWFWTAVIITAATLLVLSLVDWGTCC